MYIVRLSTLRAQPDLFFPACSAEPAPAEDYPKLYGPHRSSAIRHNTDLDFMLFRLTLENEVRGEEIERFFQYNNLGVASCDYCRTFDWDNHQKQCPITTPEGSLERELNKKGESDGRNGQSPVSPYDPVYMLGYDWGLDCKRSLERP
jgi:hypothetical protein